MSLTKVVCPSVAKAWAKRSDTLTIMTKEETFQLQLPTRVFWTGFGTVRRRLRSSLAERSTVVYRSSLLHISITRQELNRPQSLLELTAFVLAANGNEHDCD
jgi:hypothetical protein